MTRNWPTDDGSRPADIEAQGSGTAQDRVYVGMRRLATAVAPGTRSLPETLDALVRCAVEASGAVAGALYLLDADGSLRLTAGHGLERTSDTSYAAAAYEVPEAAYAAVAAGAPILTRDSHPAHPDGATPLGGDIAQVCLPLLSPEGVLGVLCCSCPGGTRPARLELAYLLLVATQASSAVDAARAREAAADEAAVSERRRLARELHDSVSQSLHSIGLGARTARELLDRDPALAQEPIDHVLQLAETSLVEMRALVFDPTADWLAGKGLVAALDEQTAAMGARHGVVVHTALGPEPPTPLKVKQALYRIAREALQNVARHARASHVTVRLVATSDHLTLEITDDGVGFDPAQPFPGHLGLTSMRERIADVGGDLAISSTRGRGTQIRARTPMWPP
jgi:signal transduction histidine kinase